MFILINYCLIYKSIEGLDFQEIDDNVKDELFETTFNLASDFKNLLSLVLGSKEENLSEQHEIMGEVSKKIVGSSSHLIKLVEKVKGKGLVNPNDPLIIAETELLKSAQAIEAAAQKLALLRPKAEVTDVVGIEFLELINMHPLKFIFLNPCLGFHGRFEF